ncbi:alpha-N-acetylglucosaminidase [Labilibacter sediminis]|nr:alpha-N-acetylglucosaminidase [Labilibacter sediminis]
MKLKYLIALIIIHSTLLGCQKKHEYDEIKGLAERLVPSISQNINFEILETNDKDIFELETTSTGNITVRGNNNLSMAVGLNHYLKYYCKTTVSWYADDSIDVPKKLPIIPNKIRKEARVQKRFFLNYCTFGYTMPWWQWKDWERFIDWMALNGVNMPLAITGQEAIWQKVWEKFGLTDQQIRSYFTGPAHLPWHRMSNLDHWGGSLPQSWLDHQLELQKKIVTRERELGMTPVLPAFAGHVPAALKKARPDAKIDKLGYWGGFDDKYRSSFLDPLDPLFPEIQKAFLEEQTKQFGTDHIYGADPFNEVEPPSWEADYLASVSKTIYGSMREIDPNAQWLQMSWIFYFERKHWTNERIEAMLKAVPQDKMVLLDYYCENTEVWPMTKSFFGQPYIWCYLGNFGGNTMLAGNISEVDQRFENAFKNGGTNIEGIGSTLEAFDVNPMMYDYVFEKAWENDNNLNEWIKNWADRRYGKENKNARKAWEILLEKVYAHPAKLGQATLTNSRPTFEGSGNWTTDPQIEYKNSDLLYAWELLLKTDDADRGTYHYDIVNIGRQVLGNHFMNLRDLFTLSYNSKDIESANKIGGEMLELLCDIDSLISTESSFLLGHWLEDARLFGENENEANYYEHNARNIITTWGGKAQSLNDYANRSWAGLTTGYYKIRWEMFINDAITSLRENKPFNEQAFFEKVTKFEADWVEGKEKYQSLPKGDGISIAKKLLHKYKDQILRN